MLTSQSSREWWSPAAPAAAVEQGSALPFAALISFIFITLVAPQTLWFPALGSLRIAMVAALVAIVGLVLDRLVRGGAVVAWTRETWLALCLAVWALATVPFSYWPGGSVSLLLEIYAKTLAVFWLLGTVVDTPKRFRVTVWTLTLISVLLAVTGVQHFLDGEFFPPGAKNEKRILGYWAPLTGNPNDLALMLNLVLPLTMALLFAQRRRAVRLLLAGIAVLNATAVVLTWSRAGFLTLAAIVGLTCWRLARRGRPVWAMLAIVVTLTIYPLLPHGYVDRLGTITSMDDDPTRSAQARWRDTIAAAEFVLAHPIIGAGAGQNMLALNEARGPEWDLVHNVYLEYAVDLGLPGLALFLLIMSASFAGVRRVRRLAAAEPSGELAHLAEGLQLSLVAFAVAALFHPAAYSPYFYDIAGLGVAMQTVAKRWVETGSGS